MEYFGFESPFYFVKDGKLLANGDYAYGPHASKSAAWNILTMGEGGTSSTLIPRGTKFAYIDDEGNLVEKQFKKAPDATTGYTIDDAEETGSGSGTSVTPGTGSKASNVGEVTAGQYNYTQSRTSEDAGTFSTVGIGTSDTSRKNAFAVDSDGNVYIIDVNGYEGTTMDEANSLQKAIEQAMIKYITSTGTDKGYKTAEATSAEGDDSYAIGTNTQANGDASLAGGVSSVANGTGSIAVGDHVATKGDGSAAFGSYNYVESDGTTKMSLGIGSSTLGYLNAFEIDADGKLYLKGVGNYNGKNRLSGTSVTDLATYINALPTTLNLLKSDTNGYYTASNDATGVKSFAIGDANTASGANAFVGGVDSISSGTNTFAFGMGITASNSNEVAFGTYNYTASGTAFSIGIGDSGEVCNALELTNLGELYLYGLGSYDGSNRTTEGVKGVKGMLTAMGTSITALEGSIEKKAQASDLAPAWEAKSYAKNTVVVHNYKLYKANTTTGATWVDSEWDTCNLLDNAGTTYTAGEGIKITDNAISTDSATQTEVDDNVTFDDTTLNDVTTKIINILGLKTMVTKIKTYVTAQIAEVKKLIINENVPVTAVNPSITLKSYTSNSYFECSNDIESLTLDLTDISAEIEYTIHFTTSATATTPFPLSITKPYKVIGDPAEFECEAGEEYELSIRNGICVLSNINTVTS